MEEFLTTGEAARLLGVSKPTVVRAIQRGLLQPALVTPGQHRRFRREDLLSFRDRCLSFSGGNAAAAAETSPAGIQVTGHEVAPVRTRG
ncbi:MAG: helix-turn-helix domain-containing protein [Chloroflexi bacterium]|nr:MAG: helix-turn-helix domain-containing protein [Chloroflexota bacterium]